MVSDELKNYYKRQGIPLIPTDIGPSFFLNELGPDTDDSTEVLVTSTIENMSDDGLRLGVT